MDLLINWVGQNQAIAWVSSLILSVSVVWAFLQKQTPKIRKALAIVEKASALINSLLDASSDQKVTVEELKDIAGHLEDLQAVLK